MSSYRDRIFALLLVHEPLRIGAVEEIFNRLHAGEAANSSVRIEHWISQFRQRRGNVPEPLTKDQAILDFLSRHFSNDRAAALRIFERIDGYKSVPIYQHAEMVEVVRAIFQPDLEERLTLFYSVYDPLKISSIPQIIQRYAGRVDELFEALVAKYGPEPPSTRGTTGTASTPLHPNNNNNNASHPPQPPPPQQQGAGGGGGGGRVGAAAVVHVSQPDDPHNAYAMNEARLRRFFEKYAPDKLPKVGAYLEKYQFQLPEMFAALINRYGAEPSVVALTPSLAAAASDAAKSNVTEASGDGDACLVCLSNKKDFCAIPCGHVVACGECVDGLSGGKKKTCPVCRKDFIMMIRIFQ